MIIYVIKYYVLSNFFVSKMNKKYILFLNCLNMKTKITYTFKLIKWMFIQRKILFIT